MKKVLQVVGFLAICLSAARTGQAQTITDTLTWTQPSDTLANVNTYTFSLKIDTGTAAQITATCATAGVNVNCTSPITLSAGNHTVVLTATDSAGSAVGTLNYTAPNLPTTPGSIVVRIVITVP